MFALLRALVYATLFIGFFLVYVPSLLIGPVPAARGFGVLQLIGLLCGAVGAGLDLSCVLAFGLLGQGTPAPFDPPRKLVARGPYRFVRNPMFIGAVLVLLGAAIYFLSMPVLVYALVFAACSHVFVLLVEEPWLRREFGAAYEDYCNHVPRWWP